MQAQTRRADESRNSLLLGAEHTGDLVVGTPLEVAQDQHCALLRREALVGGGDLASPLSGHDRELSAALVGERTCRPQQVRGHVERVEAVLGEVRERACERELDERRGGAVVARQTMTEAIDAALVAAIEQFERTPVAALHAADQRPGLAQFALARLLPGDRHRLVNPS